MDVRLFHHDGRDDYTDSTALPDGAELLLLADGMGGLEAGDQASFLAINFFLESLQTDFRERIDMTGEIARAIQTASDDLRDNCPDAGSTLVGMLTVGSMTWAFNVGDSRCLMSTANGVVRTRTHSQGDGGVITAYMGMDETVPAEILPIPDCGNAILFSDGLNPLFDGMGDGILDSDESAEMLCMKAVDLGSEDNVSCIIRKRIRSDRIETSPFEPA